MSGSVASREEKTKSTTKHSAFKLVSEHGAYQRAIKANSKVVAVDSPLERFRRVSDSDGEAMHRISMYWGKRFQLFAERATLPLNQTVHGALNAVDREVLRSGFVVILPSNSQGVPVVSIEIARIQKDYDNMFAVSDSALRCLFYIYSVVSENPRSQDSGVITLVTLSGSFNGISTEARDFVARVVDIVDHSIPVRRYRTDIVFRPPRNGKRRYLDHTVPQTIEFARACLGSEGVVSDVAVSGEKIAKNLTGRGYTLEGLPKSLGGKCTFSVVMFIRSLPSTH